MSTLGSLGKHASRSLSPGSSTRSARTPTSASTSLNNAPLSPALTPIAANHTPATPDHRNRSTVATISTPTSSPSPSTRESTPEELRALLAVGVVLRKYDLVPTGTAGAPATLKMSHIVLFAEGRGRAGSLYWFERDPAMHAPFSAPITAAERAQPVPPMTSTQRISLESITDFMLRKRSPALKHATGAGDCCFALIYGLTEPQSSLNLEAPNALVCKMTKEAIITMLTTAGKQVIKASSSSSAASAAAASTSSSPAMTSAAAPLHPMALTPSSQSQSAYAAAASTPFSAAAPSAPFSSTAPLASTGGMSLPTPQSATGSSTFFPASSPAAATATAVTPFSQATPTPTSSSLSGLDLLTRGARFMLYTVSASEPSAPVVAQEIYLWLQPPDPQAAVPIENPGALAYVVLTPSPLGGGQSQSRKTLCPGQVHWMGTLKQMQLGKLCAAFASLTPASLTAASGSSLLPSSFKPSQSSSLLTPTCCFSIVFKGASLFLEALGPGCEGEQLTGGSGGVDLGTLSPQRESIREPWIKAMHGIMMNFTTAEKARKAAAKAAAAAAAAAGNSAPAITPTNAASANSAAAPPLTPSSSYLAPTGSSSTRNLLAPSAGGASSCSFGSPSPTHLPRELSPGVGNVVPHPSLLAGMEFTLISLASTNGSGSSGELISTPILLFLSDGEDNTGTRAKFALWYTLGSCAEKDRYALLPSNRFALGAIHRLVSGKAHSAVLSSPACEHLPAERCLSIMSKAAGTAPVVGTPLTPATPATPSSASSAGLVWTLLAPSKEAREAFMKNLNQTMLKFRRGAPNAVGGSASAAAAATAAAAAASTPMPAAAPAAIPEAPLPSPDFDFLSAGHPARLYHDAGSTAYPPLAEEGLLFFELVDYAATQTRGGVAEGAGEPPGVLYFAPNGRAVPVVHEAASLPPLSLGAIPAGSSMRPQLSSVPESRRLYLHKMTQLVGGKDSTVLQHPACASLSIDKCFSICFTSREAAASVSTPSSGSHNGGGSSVPVCPLQEWNIECASTAVREKWIQSLHAIMMAFSRAKREWKQKQAEAAAAASAAAAVAAATAATASASSSTQHITASPPPVALSALDTPLSSLGGGDGDATTKLDDSTMLFRDDGLSLAGTALFDTNKTAFQGATAILRTSVGPGQTYTPSLSPRGGSVGGRDHSSARDRDPSTSPESGAIRKSSPSPFSPDHDAHDDSNSNGSSCNSAAADRHASDGSVAAATKADRSAQHQSLETERHVATLRAGQYFTLFTAAPAGAPASEAQGKAEEIFLFFQPAVGAETPGSLYWQNVSANHGAAPPAQLLASPDRKFLLNEIRQMRSGRVTPILQSALAAHVANEVCLSLSNTSVTLNLAASSLEARDGWMKAIHSLALQSGMRAKVEAVETHVNGASTMQQPRLREAHSVIVANATPAASATPTAPRHSHSHSASADRSHRLHLFGGGASAASINSTINFQDPTLFFALGARIGEGSYGSVYRATDIRDGSQVAIKIISFSGADSSKLRNEIRLLRGCASPHIISYKGAFQKQDSVWIVTELMSGGSLSDMMNICRHTFSENQIAVIMRQTLQGLAYLHNPETGPAVNAADAGGAGVSGSNDRPAPAQKRKIIIHRDIKGGNILCDENGFCKLADFGVSGSLDQSLGKHRTVIGTPHWMAPEVLTSDDYDARADVWSLGITAYELATGAPPHAELHSLRAALKIPQAPPPTLPHPERYSPELHSFMARCLVKDPAQRPSALELLEHPFIRNNKSTPAVLKEMVAKTVATIEARARRSEEEAQAAGAGGAAGTGNGSAPSPSSRPKKQSMNLDEEDSGDDDAEDVDGAYDRTTRTITNVQATANLTTVMHPEHEDSNSTAKLKGADGTAQ